MKAANPAITEAEVQGKIKELVEGGMDKPFESLIQSAGIGKKLGITKARQDIPEQIRFLMGEYNDPVINYARSASKMINLLQSQEQLNKLKEFYASEPALTSDPPVGRFLARFQPDVFIENDMSSKDTSYSENKGEKIVVCLRDKTKPPTYPLIDENTVMFVMLHEMAHLMTETIGHTQEFWTNFKRILHDAVKLGIYTQVNYAQSPVPYCGMQITDSPI
jgi:predicted metal-dependent hydrolase